MATRKAGVGLALEQTTPGTLCYVADIQPGGSADVHGGTWLPHPCPKIHRATALSFLREPSCYQCHAAPVHGRKRTAHSTCPVPTPLICMSCGQASRSGIRFSLSMAPASVSATAHAPCTPFSMPSGESLPADSCGCFWTCKSGIVSFGGWHAHGRPGRISRDARAGENYVGSVR